MIAEIYNDYAKLEWSRDWPQENGLFWFYGYRFRYDKDEGRAPELCLVDIHETAQRGQFTYAAHGHFLYEAGEATGVWQKAVLPALPQKRGTNESQV